MKNPSPTNLLIFTLSFFSFLILFGCLAAAPSASSEEQEEPQEESASVGTLKEEDLPDLDLEDELLLDDDLDFDDEIAFEDFEDLDSVG